MRIAIVNDLPLSVEALRRVVTASGEHSVAWTARDGKDAVANCKRDVPDLILMDLFMPVMNGGDATRQIMKDSPCAILVVTASVSQSTAEVFDALGAGAIDAISMPPVGTGDMMQQAAPLLKKIAMLQILAVGQRRQAPPEETVIPVSAGAPAKRPRLVAIGASAGGPGAVAEILRALRPDFPAALVLVQHVDTRFTDGLVDWLAEQSPLPVRRAVRGDRPHAGSLLVAGGDNHLTFTSAQKLEYVSEPRDAHYRPSIDIFFKSVCQYWGNDVIGVLLTGMGRDGAAGLHMLRTAGAMTIAQDEMSSVVYGMPKAAAVSGAAREILPLNQIARRLTELTQNNRLNQ